MTDLRQKGYAIEVLIDRGLARLKTGATKNALQLWDEALALDPDEPRALTYIDYVRQNWDEVDGCIDPPVPDVSHLVPNYAVEKPPAPVGNVIAPVSGGFDQADLEAKRAEAAALDARIAAAKAEAERFEAAAAAAQREAAAARAAQASAGRGDEPDAVPDLIHDAPTPKGTVEFKLGGVGGDGWGLAPESLVRQPGTLGGSRPWQSVAAFDSEAESEAGIDLPLPAADSTEPSLPMAAPTSEEAAAAIASEVAPAPDTIEDAPIAPSAPAAAPAAASEVTTTDEAMAPALAALFGEDALTNPRIALSPQAELDALGEQATKTYPRPIDALVDAATGTYPRAVVPAPVAPPTASEIAARTLTPVMPLAGRTATPVMSPAMIAAAAKASAVDPDEEFERGLDAAFADSPSDVAPAAAAPPEAPAAVEPVAALEVLSDAVPTPIGGGLDDDEGLDLPEPVELPAPVADVASLAAAPAPEAAASPAGEPAPYEPPAGGDPFGEEKQTVWSPIPPMPVMSLAERVEKAMRDREADPFAEEKPTTAWAAPPATLVEATRPADEELPPLPAWARHTRDVAAGEEGTDAAEASDDAPSASPPALELPTPGAEELARLDADIAPPSDRDGVFDRVTTLLPIDRELSETAPPPAEPAPISPASLFDLPTPPGGARVTLPMAAARVTAPMSAQLVPPEPEGLGLDDIELAPRSGVGLGAYPPVRLDVRTPSFTLDDEVGPLERVKPPTVPPIQELDPLERATYRPPPVPTHVLDHSRPQLDLEPEPELDGVPELEPELEPDDDEVPLEDADLLADDDGAPASARVATLPRGQVVDAAAAALTASRASTRDLGATASAALDASAPAPIVPAAPLPAPLVAPSNDDVSAFDGPEPQTVTVVPESIEQARPASEGAIAELPDSDDPFELPTAPITPLPDPEALRRLEAEALATQHKEPELEAAPLELEAANTDVRRPEATTAEIEPTDAEAAAAGPEGPRAKTLELLPAGAAPLWSPPPTDSAYQVDTADLTPRIPVPPQDLAAPVAVTTQMPPPRRDASDPAGSATGWDAETNVFGYGRLAPAPAWQPAPLEPTGAAGEPPSSPPPLDPEASPDTLDRLRRGDEVWAHDPGERLGARLSPAVLRGLGLQPMNEGATTEEPTRNGWPTGRRPAPPMTRTADLAPPDEAASGAAPQGDLDDLAMQDLELPSPRTTTGTRTPGEVLLRSSAPEALASALASELDRGAPAGESADDRARRRITALLERASAAARAGEHPMSIAAIDLALSEAPDSAVAQKLVHRSRDIILDCYTRYFGDLQRRPVPVGSLAELTGRALDPRAAFLVSRMDGNLTYEEILDVAGMGRLEACRHLAQLLVRGIIRAS